MTWAIVPFVDWFRTGAVAIFVSLAFDLLLERFRASNNFNQFSGNRGLTAAVILDGKLVDQVAGIARGVVHCGHRCALFGCSIFEQGAEKLSLHIAWQQLFEDFFFVRLIFDNSVRLFAVSGAGTGRSARSSGSEPAPIGMSDKQVSNVELAGFEHLDQLFGDLRSFFKAGIAHVLVSKWVSIWLGKLRLSGARPFLPTR